LRPSTPEELRQMKELLVQEMHIDTRPGEELLPFPSIGVMTMTIEHEYVNVESGPIHVLDKVAELPFAPARRE